MFRLLHAVPHGTEALVYSNYQREAAASTCLAIIKNCANTAPASVQV